MSVKQKLQLVNPERGDIWENGEKITIIDTTGRMTDIYLENSSIIVENPSGGIMKIPTAPKSTVQLSNCVQNLWINKFQLPLVKLLSISRGKIVDGNWNPLQS
jgi:hypothetical protein